VRSSEREGKDDYEATFWGHRLYYKPDPGDKYVTYWVLGVMPIDVIYDAQGRVVFYDKAYDY